MYHLQLKYFSLLKRIRFFLITFLFSFIIVPQYLSSQVYPKHEMRAVWIATVNNIDWPSSPNLSTPTT